MPKPKQVAAVARRELAKLTEIEGKFYDTACDLARGFYCGFCDEEQATRWGCFEHGCCSLRDGIFEELKAAYDLPLSTNRRWAQLG